MKIRFADREQISVSRLAELLGAHLSGEASNSAFVTGICTDSREADAETLFVAIRGERVDGHDFIVSAVENGAPAVLCERAPTSALPAAVLTVPDPVRSLSVLAEAHIASCRIPTVAVTGSVGKTTTKDMITSVLQTKKKTFCTEGNHNSLIGMPMAALELSRKSEIAVFEMGMSGFGEIERLSCTVHPTLAVITNIGSSHMEMLGSRENIRRAKLEILSGLQTGGTLLINGDDPDLKQIRGRAYRTLRVSIKDPACEFSAQGIRLTPAGTEFDILWNGTLYSGFSVSVIGEHHVYAALFAFAVGVLSGLNPDDVRLGLSGYQPSHLRQNKFTFGGMTVFADCYNASPESMRAALKALVAFAEATDTCPVAILGDMLELGEGGAQMHREVGAFASECGLRRLITVGTSAREIARGAILAGMNADSITEIPTLDEPEHIDRILCTLTPGDAVMIKASRSMRLERIADRLKPIS